MNNITQLLRREFYDALKSRSCCKSRSINVNVLAAAEDRKYYDAIFVDIKANQCRDDRLTSMENCFLSRPSYKLHTLNLLKQELIDLAVVPILRRGGVVRFCLQTLVRVESLEASVGDRQNAGEEHCASNESNPKSSHADVASASQHGSSKETGNHGKN
ncbi:hypothetical protein ACFX1X_020720 [Malus domestica]